MKLTKRMSLVLATAALFAFTGCKSGDAKVAQATPQAEAAEGGCCSDGGGDGACAAETSGCCAGEAKTEKK